VIQTIAPPNRWRSANVRQERSGWRDLWLSDRHRLWGYDCPADDIDFIEYADGNPRAVVQYKHERAAKIPHLNVRQTWPIQLHVMVRLCERARLPAFICRYAADGSWWDAAPLNDLSRRWLPKRRRMTERQWVELLYRMRGYTTRLAWERNRMQWDTHDRLVPPIEETTASTTPG